MGVYPILTFRAEWIYPIFGVAILAFCWFLPYVVVSAAAILSKSATKENQSTVQVKSVPESVRRLFSSSHFSYYRLSVQQEKYLLKYYLHFGLVKC